MSAPSTPVQKPVNPPSRVLMASLVGTTIEFYDFYVYATAAVLVFPHLFFPEGDATTALLASFAIFQFLWVWNDLLVALTFAGGTPEVAPMTVRLAQQAGSLGGRWELLTAGAFLSIIVPLIVFFSLQRYFVRGLLAGSVKG